MYARSETATRRRSAVRLYAVQRANGRALRRPAVLLALLWLLALPLLWRSLVAAPALRVEVGAWGDHTFLSGVNSIEESATENYRWSTARSVLTLPNLSGRYQLLRLRAHGWRPDPQTPSPQVQLAVAHTPWGSVQTTPGMRVYNILLPQDTTSPHLQITFTSQYVIGAGDGRQIGFALDWIEVRALNHTAAPSFWHFGAQTLLLGLLALLLGLLALPTGWTVGLAALLGGALIWANFQQPLWVSQAIIHWLIIAVLLLGLTWQLEPRLRRSLAPWMTPEQARLAWALFIAALALRLAGSAHPLFNAHDVDVHMRWLTTVDGGQLFFYSTPGELRNRQTFNPPAGYVLLLPLWLLLPTPRLVVQIGVALVDALGCLLLLPIARELGLPARAGLLALALYLALPINMTMLWWGFATNAMAQSLWLLLLWVLLRIARRPSRSLVLIFAVVCTLNVLMHAGALVLAIAMLMLCLLLGWPAMTPGGRRAALGGVALALLVTIPLYFSAAAGPVLGQSNDPTTTLDLGESLAKGWVQRELRLGLVGRGLQLGLLAPLLVLAPAALARLAAHARHPLGRAVIAAWLLVCGAFLTVYLGLGLTTRYIYFVAPLVCLGSGTLLASLSRRNGGRISVIALVLFVAVIGVSIWAAGVLLRVKPSVVPLTH